MITRLKLKPGQKGTKQLVEKYGDALICVRYRYDVASNTRIKTVELVEEKKDLKSPQQKLSDNAIVPVRVAYGEQELGRLVRAAGGRWDSDVKLWYVKYGKIKDSELERHILLDPAMKSGKR